MVIQLIGRFAISSHEHNGVVFLCPEGELDLAAVDSFKQELSHIQPGMLKLLVLDLRLLTFMDSTGIHMIIEAGKIAGESNDQQRLAIAAGPPEVMRILEIAGLIDTFEIWQTGDSEVQEPKLGRRRWLSWDGSSTSRPPVHAVSAQMTAFHRRAYR